MRRSSPNRAIRAACITSAMHWRDRVNWKSAIDAYEQALEIDPDDADAAYNRDLLKSMLEQQQQAEQENGEQQQADQQGDGEQSESDSDSDQESESEDGDGEPQDGDPSQRDEEMSEEDMEALQEELQRAAEQAQQNQENPAQQPSAEELEAMRRRPNSNRPWNSGCVAFRMIRAHCCATSFAINIKRPARTRMVITPGPTTRYSRGKCSICFSVCSCSR